MKKIEITQGDKDLKISSEGFNKFEMIGILKFYQDEISMGMHDSKDDVLINTITQQFEIVKTLQDLLNKADFFQRAKPLDEFEKKILNETYKQLLKKHQLEQK